ncbi:hypothetical protein GLAREA_08491 [Glarea lozoyensis ATCC 20868]|uniref:2EXR domain-containing protein n=1 Tax=Glarea lozoyensis (strain ATCC 20868 / MF5171) TaxID=1116229 RepID=S3DD80_GLAL2|nr:uncharacterized protein GLAREA_08491 [Glarea lozoyensis ATCC 20868]EPE24638.1 hypothetical protein GLAREA_08491 [Glarea lozoyensis ATCC 20868]
MNASASSQAFFCFGSLPVELRIKIWEAALPTPRIIWPYHKDNPTTVELQDWEALNHTDRTKKSKFKIFTLLFVCNESHSTCWPLWVDPNRDTIVLRIDYFNPTTEPKFDLSRLENLAYTSTASQDAMATQVNYTGFALIKQQCPALQTLTFIAKESLDEDGWPYPVLPAQGSPCKFVQLIPLEGIFDHEVRHILTCCLQRMPCYDDLTS